MQFWLKLNTNDFSPRPRPQVSGYFSFWTQKCPRPHALIRVEIEFARPHVSDTYLDSIFHPGLPGNIGNRKCVIKPANFVSCSTFHDKELGSILLHHRIKNIYRQYVAQYPDGTSIRTLETNTQFLRRPFQFSINKVFPMNAEHFSFKMNVLAI